MHYQTTGLVFLQPFSESGIFFFLFFPLKYKAPKRKQDKTNKQTKQHESKVISGHKI